MDNITSTLSNVSTSAAVGNEMESHFFPDTDEWSFTRAFEFVFLLIICVFGTIGNFTVIFSIILEKRVHQQGNIFVINLAIADLLVTGFVIPTVMMNILDPPRTLDELHLHSDTFICQVTGYIVTMACTCSTNNLMLISLNRYLAIVHTNKYQRYFNTKKVYMMAVVAWLYSNALCLPTLLGWTKIAYDEKMQVCSWDDDYSMSYTYFLTIFALMVPMTLTAVFYFHLFWSAKKTGRWVRKLSRENGALGSGNKENGNRQFPHRRLAERERSLLMTLLTAMTFFYLCWIPYGLIIFVDAKGANPTLKKAGGWIGMTNSTVNFVIYGAMNACYRRGYRHLFYFIFTCKRKSTYDSEIFGHRHQPLSNRNSNMSRSGGHNSLDRVASNSSANRPSPCMQYRAQIMSRPLSLRRLQNGARVPASPTTVYHPRAVESTIPASTLSTPAVGTSAEVVPPVRKVVSQPVAPLDPASSCVLRTAQDPEIMSRSSSEASLRSNNSLLKKHQRRSMKTESSPKITERGIEMLTRGVFSTKSLPSIIISTTSGSRSTSGGGGNGEFFNLFHEAIKQQAHGVIINHTKKNNNNS